MKPAWMNVIPREGGNTNPQPVQSTASLVSVPFRFPVLLDQTTFQSESPKTQVVSAVLIPVVIRNDFRSGHR